MVSPPINSAIPMRPSLPTTAISVDGPSSIGYSSETMESVGKYTWLRRSPGAGGRGKLLEPPAGIDPLEHGRDEGILQVAPRWQLSRLEQFAVRVADGVPARLLGRLQRIESRAAHGHKRTGAPDGESIHTWTPPSAKRCSAVLDHREIAAIHPDFGAAMPLSLMEYAG